MIMSIILSLNENEESKATKTYNVDGNGRIADQNNENCRPGKLLG
jgi:hypothetical protein